MRFQGILTNINDIVNDINHQISFVAILITQVKLVQNSFAKNEAKSTINLTPWTKRLSVQFFNMTVASVYNKNAFQ